MNKLLLVIVALLLAAVIYWVARQPGAINAVTTIDSTLIKKELAAAHEAEMALAKLHNFSNQLQTFAAQNRYATDVAFLIDMSLPSGKKRFFVYDLQADTIIHSGLVAHGSCNERFLKKGKFSNTVNSGCTSTGKYKVGHSYNGNFGKAYKLFGLDSTNNKAFERFVVLHAYSCVPDDETYPQPICNSLGCPMVSYTFLNKLENIIDNTRKPILLWIYQ